METIYHWNDFVDGEFQINSDPDIEVLSLDKDFQVNELLYPLYSFFLRNYSHFKLPPSIYSKLRLLLREFNLEAFQNELIIFGLALQSKFKDSFAIEEDAVLAEFNTEAKDMEKLLKVLKKYIFTKNNLNLPKISFTPFNSKTISIDNGLLVNDILKSLCIQFELNASNFEQRSEELLMLTKKVIPSKFDEKVKVDYIKALFEFTQRNLEINESNSLKLIGVFFNLFQIPLNKKNPEILIFEDLQDCINDVDVKALKHYISRPPSLYK